MNEVNNETQLKVMSKNLKLVLIVIILVLILLGSTFAYFAVDAFNNEVIGGDAGTIDLSLTVTKILPTSDGVDNILITSFDELASSLNDSCVDSDGEYALCQLYKINLTNASNSVNTEVRGRVSFNNETVPNLSWIYLGNSYSSSTTYTSAMLGSEFNTASPTFVNFVDSYLLDAGDSVDFYILVWVNEALVQQDDEGIYSGVIRFDDSKGKGVTAVFSS